MRSIFVISAFLAMSAASSGPSVAQDAGGAPFAAASYSYICADGMQIEVAYINMDAGLSLAVLHLDGRMLVMQHVQSGSGARYATVSVDPGGSERYVWWTRGNEAVFQKGPPGEEEMVHTACEG